MYWVGYRDKQRVKRTLINAHVRPNSFHSTKKTLLNTISQIDRMQTSDNNL